MTIDEKDNWRLRFKMLSIGLVFGVLVGGIILALNDRVSGFAGIAGAVCTFAGAVFGIDYYTSPKDKNKKEDNEFNRRH